MVLKVLVLILSVAGVLYANPFTDKIAAFHEHAGKSTTLAEFEEVFARGAVVTWAMGIPQQAHTL